MESYLDRFKDFDTAISFFKSSLRSGDTINNIVNEYEIEKDYLIHLLLKSSDIDETIMNSIKDSYNEFKISDDKCLVISDTHIGSYDEDLALILQAYEYAYKNNIKEIIHAGDLIEGLSDINGFKHSLNIQISNAYNFYNCINDITTYYLYGNHDYNVYLYDKVSLKEKLENIKNLIYIGTENSYINNGSDILKVSHECSKNWKNTPLFNYSILLEGHHHKFRNIDSGISLPALRKLGGSINDSGFIELINDDDKFVAKHIGFNSDYSVKVKSINEIKKRNT